MTDQEFSNLLETSRTQNKTILGCYFVNRYSKQNDWVELTTGIDEYEEAYSVGWYTLKSRLEQLNKSESI